MKNVKCKSESESFGSHSCDTKRQTNVSEASMIQGIRNVPNIFLNCISIGQVSSIGSRYDSNERSYISPINSCNFQYMNWNMCNKIFTTENRIISRRILIGLKIYFRMVSKCLFFIKRWDEMYINKTVYNSSILLFLYYTVVCSQYTNDAI